MNEPIKICQYGEDLYVTVVKDKVEMQIDGTCISIDRDSIYELIQVLKKLEP